MKVFVVDDIKWNRMQMRKELEEDGYEVHEARDSTEALSLLSLVKPDIIILNREMPTMDGMELCKKIRRAVSSESTKTAQPEVIPIIFIAAEDSLESRSVGHEAGATDYIVKPLRKGDLLQAVNRRLKPDSILKGLTAVVVEDNETTLLSLSQLLRKAGARVLQARNGREAFELISRSISSIDLVISDLVMPEMGGYELCSKIRGELMAPELPFIILTAITDHATLLQLFDAGASDYIVKPFVKEELLARIKVHMEVRLLNRELRNKIDDLAKMDQMKSQFLAACSHDLRSPLSGILGITDVLLKSPTLKEKEKELVSLIQKSGEYLCKLIIDILEIHVLISQDRELEMEPISLSDVAKSCIETMKYMALPKGIQIDFVEKTAVPASISGDALALKRIFNNLLSNAIKFTFHKGTVTVTIDAPDERTRSISVADTGMGMAMEKIEEITGKKKVTSSKGTDGEAGTGIGLTIAKDLVTKHGGGLLIESEQGQGSRFTVTFPAEPLL
jgi:two-component system, sensor histidine kinase and response regulator